jgi:antirestriction protein ArdC
MAENTTAHKDRLKEITDSIEQGIKDLFQSDKYMEYLRTMSRFHRYSLNNTLLIAMQRPDATLVAGFNKWRDQFGRNVRRGEKGIKIIAPTPFKKKIEQEKLDPLTKAPMLDKDGKIVTEEVEIKIPLYKVVSVFDVSQTEGKPLPQLASNLTGDVKQYEIFMEALRRSSPVPMGFERIADNSDGYFSLTDQRIAIREGMSEVQTVSAAIHEIGHAKLHNREQEQLAAVRGDETAEPPKPKSRRTEEVEAESISFAVCAYYGIATGENSFGYIASWSKDKELPELRASLETINKTASDLISDIDRNFAQIAKERGIDLSAQKAEEITAADLAVAIDEFSYDYDPYGYRDAVDDREAALADLTANIERGDASYMKDWLLSIVNENDEYSPKAQQLLEQYERFTQNVHVPESEQAAPVPPATPEPDILYQTHTNPRSEGEHDRSFIQAYARVDGALIPDEVIGVGAADKCIGLTNRLNSKDIQPEQAKTELAQPPVAASPEPPAADGYPMPDPTLTIADRNAYGYTEDDMLPVSKDKAIELYEKDFTIYMLYNDDGAGMAFDRDDIDGHIGMFGINREEWKEGQEYLSLIEGHEVTQQELENNFLNNPADAFAIYQLKRTEETRDLRFEPLERLQAVGLTVERDNYDLIYTDRLTDTGSSTSEKLNALWERFNIDHPADYRGHSLSISDIVALKQNGAVSCHYVDDSFKELPAFLRPENYLKNAEMAMEDDYGMIDGIINNGKNPSVAELEAQVKAGGQISLSDLARAIHDERMEKRPSVLEQLKMPPVKQERHKTAPSRGAEMER